MLSRWGGANRSTPVYHVNPPLGPHSRFRPLKLCKLFAPPGQLNRLKQPPPELHCSNAQTHNTTWLYFSAWANCLHVVKGQPSDSDLCLCLLWVCLEGVWPEPNRAAVRATTIARVAELSWHRRARANRAAARTLLRVAAGASSLRDFPSSRRHDQAYHQHCSCSDTNARRESFVRLRRVDFPARAAAHIVVA